VGFSPNEQKIEVASSAAVELLATVGLQRFRPVVSGDRQSFEYATWGRPLAPPVAAAAAAAAIRVDPATRYRGRVVSRGSYAALGHSTVLRGEGR
jgi:CRISPR-associated protein Csb3